MANPDVHFPHDSDSDKNVEIPETYSRLLSYSLPKSKLESSSHKYHPINMASFMPHRDRKENWGLSRNAHANKRMGKISEMLYIKYLQILRGSKSLN